MNRVEGVKEEDEKKWQQQEEISRKIKKAPFYLQYLKTR